MGDRTIVYSGSLPQSTDYLTVQRNTMIALGFLAQATLGTSTVVDGLACTPQTVPNLTVNVGPGSIVSLSTVDASAYGSLAADSADALVKMGINLTTTLSTAIGTLAAPTTTGQSINYLIEASFQESDATAVVLPYYNSANPAVPYSGPANAGTAQNTQRLQRVNLQIKAGSPATTGSQVTPAPDAGFVGLWVITVAYAQTTIVAGNITQYPGAPFIAYKIPALATIGRLRITANVNYYVAPTGSDTTGTGTSTYPWQTINHALGYIANNLDGGGQYTATVNLAAGTYGPVSIAVDFVGFVTGGVVINGNSGSPSSTIIQSSTASNALYAIGPATSIAIQYCQLTTTGSSNAIQADQGATVFQKGCIFASVTAGFSHMDASNTGRIIISGNYSIAGGAGQHLFSNGTGVISVATGGSVVTITGTPAFSVAFALAQVGSSINAGGMTFSGSATGNTYIASGNGAISTNGGGSSFFPGNVAGSTSTGGQYV